MQEAKKNVILRVFRTAHCPPGKYFFGVTCSALSVLLSGVPFYTVYRIIRLFLLASLDGAAAPTREIWMWAAVTIGSIVLGIVLSVIGSFSCHACAFNALYDLRMRLLDHMGRLNLGFYTGGQSGATQKMMNENIEKMENIIAHDVSNIFGAGLLLAALAVLMFSLNIPLALTIFIALVLAFLIQFSAFGGKQGQKIDLHVKKGELVILSGRSGCGKTTLTRILNGLCPGFYPGKLEGGYSLDGEDALKMPIHRLGTMVGSVFQDPRSQFFATNTTDEIVLGMENIPLERPVMQERLNTVCKQMNIERLIDRRIFPLSSGEKQLIAIASVCAMEPKVIVLDEPSANLDSEAMVRLGALLYRLKMAGHTVILSEHRFHYVRDSFDRLVFMEDGAISAVYDRKNALSLTAEQMTAMGLRPFDAPAFRVGGAYRQNQDDALQVSAISCMLDSQQILEEVSFAAQSGKILAIAGPNGAGKSTLCRIITGLYRAMGSVSLDGEILKRKRLTQKSFFVQQDSDYQLYAPTVLDEFSLGKKETAELKETALSRLREMGLEAFTDRHPASLSGGQKQRLLLALAAASGRSLLVFDEPTSGLDGFNMHLTVDLLKRLAGEGRCILLITHDMKLIAEAADGVLYIEGGKLRYHRNVLRQMGDDDGNS